MSKGLRSVKKAEKNVSGRHHRDVTHDELPQQGQQHYQQQQQQQPYSDFDDAYLKELVEHQVILSLKILSRVATLSFLKDNHLSVSSNRKANLSKKHHMKITQDDKEEKLYINTSYRTLKIGSFIRLPLFDEHNTGIWIWHVGVVIQTKPMHIPSIHSHKNYQRAPSDIDQPHIKSFKIMFCDGVEQWLSLDMRSKGLLWNDIPNHTLLQDQLKFISQLKLVKLRAFHRLQKFLKLDLDNKHRYA